MRFGFRRVSTKIAVYAVTVLTIACVGFAFLAYDQGSKAVMEEVERALNNYSREAARHLDSKIQSQFDVLQTIASRSEMMWMDWGAQRLVLRSEIERLNQFNAFGVVNPDGLIRFNDGTTSEMGDNPYIKAALEGSSTVSDLFVDPSTGEMSIIFAVPIYSYDNVVGALIGRRDYAALSEVVDDLGIGDEGWAYLISSSGVIMAHPLTDLVLGSVSIFDSDGDFAPAGAAIRNLGLGTIGVVRYTTNDGARRIDALAPVGLTGWTLAVGALEDDVLGNVTELRSFMLAVSAFFVLLGIIAAMLLGRQIARPLEKVRGVMDQVAEGNLTSRVEVKTQDEVGVVAEALNQTVARISEALEGVANATGELTRMSQEMAAAAEEVSASVEEVASTTNEFSTTIEAVNTRAQGVRDRAERVSQQASSGEKALNDIVTELSVVRDNSQSLSDNILQLGTLSEEIDTIVGTITAIADQTDLLALNAAIEAARAGEHGRGFAVVAEEVRRLAEQSGKAATEITDLIREIQTGITSAVTGMGQGARQADHALSRVNESSAILRQILEAVAGIVEEVQHISDGLEQVNLSGADIASVTEEQAASITQVSISAQDLTNMAAQLKELVDRFQLS